jgi:hypothetical protein
MYEVLFTNQQLHIVMVSNFEVMSNKFNIEHYNNM